MKKNIALLIMLFAIMLLGSVLYYKHYQESKETLTEVPVGQEGTEQENVFTDEVTMQVGEMTIASGITLSLNSFVADNRCPIDVNCIEAGAVTVNLTMISGDQKVTRNFPSDEVPFQFAGTSVSLIKVSPEANSKVEIKPEDYRVTFKIQ